MTPIANMVRQMLEKGVSHEAIVIAVEGAELVLLSAPRPQMSADESADRRREKDRIRKQIERDNLRISADVRGNPQMSENAPLSKEEKKEEVKEELEARKPSVRGQRLPEGWTPTPQDWATSGELLSEPRAKAELDKFTDHWKQQPGSKGVKLDWNAAWRNWTRRAAEYGARPNGKASNANDTLGGFSGLAAQLRRKIAEQEADDDARSQESFYRR